MTRQEVAHLEAVWLRAQLDVERLERAHNWSMSSWRQRRAIAETKYFDAARQLREELDAKGR